MIFKRRKVFVKEAHRIQRLGRMADGILNGDDCQFVWAKREGLSVAQICRDFEEIFANWLVVAKWSVRKKRSIRVRQLEEKALFPAMRSFELSKRVLSTCGDCQGEGYLKNEGACLSCRGEGVIERYDTPGDATWLRVVNETVKEIAKIEGLHTKSLPPKPPRKHLHLHANASDLWEYANDEEVIQRRVLNDKLQRRMENGRNGDGVKVIDVKKENRDEESEAEVG